MTTTLKAPVSLGGAHGTKKPSPVAHLSAEDIENLARELDVIRDEVLQARGESDAKYIRRLIKANRQLEVASRGVLLFSLFPPAWLLGTIGLSIHKILDNMEIGHNVMHGQWDWMRDPKIHSSTWEWDNVNPAPLWKHTHNELHHTWANVLGKDHDIGYGLLRMEEGQRWSPFFIGQPLYNVIMCLTFEWMVAVQDLELANKRIPKEVRAERWALVREKIKKQALKDYVLHPLLSGPSFLTTALANFTANIVRNVWSHSVIFCGHFPADVQTFEYASIKDETRGDWYIRQMMGSANISGGALTHLMTGNLSFQIEHHLWPDLPSNRYKEVAPKVQAICERYGIPYVTGPLPKQVYEAWAKVVRLAAPNNFWSDTRDKLLAGPKALLNRGKQVADVLPLPKSKPRSKQAA